PLHNYDPPTTEDDMRAAALQYVRKVSGMTRPSRANEAAFDRAVDAVSAATAALLADLVATAPPRDRALEVERARARGAARHARPATRAACSAGVPGRPPGVSSPAARSSSVEEAVSIQPGATEFAVIPARPYSIAIVRMSPSMAALAAA